MTNTVTIMGWELLEGERVRLRRIAESDTAEIGAWGADMEYQRLLRRGMVYPGNEADVKQWMINPTDDFYPFAIVDKADDRVVGVVALKDVMWSARQCQFFIGIGRREDRGRGYASDALRVMLRYAFMEMNMNRVGLEVSDYNPDARRLYAHVGFQHEGTLRQFVYRDGVYHDMHIMSILRAEWDRQQARAERIESLHGENHAEPTASGA